MLYAQYCQFGRFIEVKLSMSPNKEIFKFLTIFSLFSDFFLYSYEMRVCFFILHCIIYTSYSNSFWDCANGFVNIFNVHNDFNATNNFIRFLNFTYSFVEVNVDVSYDDSCDLSEQMVL